MKLQFDKTVCKYLNTVAREVREQEQTQEVKLPDGLPDIGTIIGAWGQVVLRSKEWRSSGMQVSGGVMAWVLYAPEDGSDPRHIETWIPFQLKWDFPDTDQEGTIRVSAMLRSMDARTVSARKMMLRAGIWAVGEALVPGETAVFLPKEVPEGMEMLRRTYPTRLPVEAGEKNFLVDEELTLPGSVPALERLVRYDVLPELLDSKVMAGRLVFRGTVHLHILYRGDNGQLQSWDFEIPFSQFTELDRDYDQDAEASVVPAVTNLELEATEDGTIHLKCGAIAQYVILDQVLLKLVEDAYSIHRSVTPQVQELVLPAVLEDRKEILHGEQTIPVSGNRIVDVSFLPACPDQSREPGQVTITGSGSFRVLYYDEDGSLQSATAGWEAPWTVPVAEESRLHLAVRPSGRPQVSTNGGNMTAKGDLTLCLQTVAEKGLSMVTELEVGEPIQPDPERPSLILRRVGEEPLWDIAKKSGSTVEAIRQANHLQEEPEFGQLLLIPVS